MARKRLFIVVTFVALILLSNTAWARSGKEYKFRGGFDGDAPRSGLVSDGAGNFYGTTAYGGLNNCQNAPSCGTVFKVTLGQNGSWNESVIYKFQGGTDGAFPQGALTFDSSGDLYGTTTGGGLKGSGTVFKLSPNQSGTWTESIIYSFQSNTDGSYPTGVIFDSAGNLYGVNMYGGAAQFGAVFKLTPTQSGGWTELARLRQRAEGLRPVEPPHYVFAAFTSRFNFSAKREPLDYATSFDPTRHLKSWRSAWRTLTKKAGLPGFRFHDLRHCAITQLAESGAPESTIMAIAGHVSRRMLERYSHVRMEAKRKAVEALAASTRTGGYDTNHDTNALLANARPV